MLDKLGLKEMCDYSDAQVEIFHLPSDSWYPLVETKRKIVLYLDENENVRRASVNSIDNVNFIKGKENTNPAPKVDTSEPEKVEMDTFPGLTSNTSYEDSGLEVNHIDKGWLPLVRTAKKVVFYEEDGMVRRMTPAKFGGVKNPAEEPAPFEESVDSFLFSDAA